MELSRIEILDAIMVDVKKPTRILAVELGLEERYLTNFISRNGMRKGDLIAGKRPSWYEKEKAITRKVGGLNRVEVIDFLLENRKKSMSSLAWELGETPKTFERYRDAMGINRVDLNKGIFPAWYLAAKRYKKGATSIKDDSDRLNWYALYACIRNLDLSVSEAVAYMGLGERIIPTEGEDLNVKNKIG